MNPDEMTIENTSDIRKNIGDIALEPGEKKEIDIDLYEKYYRSISSLDSADLINIEVNERRTLG